MALDPLLTGIVFDALKTVGREIDARVAESQAYKRANPCDASVFHATFARSLPWWQFPRVWWHRDQARRWGAWCSAEEQRACAADSETAGRLAARERRALRQKKRAQKRAIKAAAAAAETTRGPDDSGPVV